MPSHPERLKALDECEAAILKFVEEHPGCSANRVIKELSPTVPTRTDTNSKHIVNALRASLTNLLNLKKLQRTIDGTLHIFRVKHMTFQPSDFKKSNMPWLEESICLLTLHGSHAYGTNIESSDIDVKGVAIAPLDYYLGFNKKYDQAEFKEPCDAAIYEIQKFFKLASDLNPNICEVLFCEPEDILFVSPIGQKILDNRDLFLSKKAKFTFSGYAISQLKRIKNHREKQNHKHAMHLVRLMRMAEEILSQGRVIVKRPDREELLEIRSGNYHLEQLIEWAELQDEKLNKLYETSNVLPKKPNRNKLDKLCEEVIMDFHRIRTGG